MRKQPLSREAILDAAVALLDRDGMAGLSMRRSTTISPAKKRSWTASTSES
jgi:DNA-binding transcriptional regulator YbjK